MTKVEQKVFDKHLMQALQAAIGENATEIDIEVARELSALKNEMNYAVEINKKNSDEAAEYAE